MEREDIIEMARRAGLHRNQHNLASNPVQYKFSYDGTEEALIAFAKLVAAKERKAICGTVQQIVPITSWAYELLDAIRARGGNKE